MKIALLVIMIVAAVFAISILTFVIVDIIREKKGHPSLLYYEGKGKSEEDK